LRPSTTVLSPGRSFTWRLVWKLEEAAMPISSTAMPMWTM